MNRSSLLASALWLALAANAHAETSADAGGAPINDFQRVQVIATRGERAIAEVPNTVDVIDREQLDDRLIRNIKDLARYEPGVSVTSGFGRFTSPGGFRIRGLEGNRVLIQTDGIAVADNFSFGSYLNANRNFVDLDTLKRVEIMRGPASSLYGSDALGGVVAYVTKDPSDYLQAGKDAHFGFKLGYEGQTKGLFGSATAAFGGEHWSGMVVAGHRQGRELQNQGSNASTELTQVGPAAWTMLRTLPNPMRYDGRSLLSKLVYAPSQQQRFKLVVDANEDRSRIDAYTGRSRASGFTTGILDQTGRDHQTRARISLEHEVDALETGFADSLDWKLYRQDSETTQRTFELRSNNTRRFMQHNFEQRLYGLQGTLRKAFATGDVAHDLTYGVDATVSKSRAKRDGTSTHLTTGVVSNVVGQDRFPVRDFPISQATKVGVFLQDEMRFAEERFSLVPGVRVDYYKLEPRLDTIFAEDNPGVVVSGLSETSVSPKLGAIWQFNEQWSLFGNYARGFRSPPYGDVNVGFTNLQGGYTVIANPELKPETSNGFELGLRFANAAVYAGLTGYHNDYRDFIESLVLVSAPGVSPMVFQSRNVSEARIRGLEFKAGVDFGDLSEALQGWSLNGSVAYSRGDNRTSHTALNSVDPLRGTLALAYERDAWGLEAVGSFASRKQRPASPGQYRPAGYGVVDLLAHWRFASGLKWNVGVMNVGDIKYTDWSDVHGLAASSPVLDRYTRPGRTLSTSLSVEW